MAGKEEEEDYEGVIGPRDLGLLNNPKRADYQKNNCMITCWRRDEKIDNRWPRTYVLAILESITCTPVKQSFIISRDQQIQPLC